MPDRPWPASLPAAGNIAAVLVLAVVVVIGWRELWFLSTDAYVPFRYINNRRLGLGYVWNPPPFRAVEGYPSFLWMALLDAAWSLADVPPPRMAPILGLLLGMATLWQCRQLLAEMWLPSALEKVRGVLSFVALLGVAVNRTFVMWLSSGLETSLFVFLFVWWVRSALNLRRRRATLRLAIVALAAVLAALTRPEGLLLILATLALAVWAWRGGQSILAVAAACAPLAVMALHAIWRRVFYGAWLPKAAIAAYQGPWPEAGARYLASFVLEYAVWMWLVLVASAGRALLGGRARAGTAVSPPVAIAVATVVAYAAGSTLLIGGDPFEYRVYAPLVPLLFVSGVWAVAHLDTSAIAAVGTLASWVVLSALIPWVHHVETRAITSRIATVEPVHPVAPTFPAAVRPYVALFDDLQGWLIARGIGRRHREQRVLHDFLSSRLPSRAQGERLRFPDLAAHVSGAAGMTGWMLPHVAIIDLAGASDPVLPRLPRAEGARRHRLLPARYAECYEPNVSVVAGRVIHTPRRTPLTPGRIAACERLVDLFVDPESLGPLGGPGRPRYASGVDLGAPSLPGFELGDGWLRWERWSGMEGGRWTGREATLRLGRRPGMGALLLDVTAARPVGHTIARVEVNGRVLGPLPSRQERLRTAFDIGSVPGPILEVHFRVDNPYVPAAHDPASRDTRELGVFVHGVHVVDSVLPAVVDLGRVPNGAAGLGTGWWSAEPWSDRLAGRWTRGEAVLHLARRHGESALLVDATFLHPTGFTDGGVEVDGTLTARFRRENGRGLLLASIPAGAQSTIRAHLVVDHPYVPGRLAGGRRDDRVLGMFVHSVRLIARAANGSGAFPSSVEPAAVSPTAKWLQYGWGSVGVAADGRRGRWTDGAAGLLLAAPGPGTLIVELAPGGDRWARGHVEADGAMVGEYVVGPEGGTVQAELEEVSGGVLTVRVVTDVVSRSISSEDPIWPSGGILVHRARFAPR